MRRAFWKVRLATLLWGFAVVYIFTGRLGLTSRIFMVQAAGNTAIMWALLR